jgi:hypothetical protein
MVFNLVVGKEGEIPIGTINGIQRFQIYTIPLGEHPGQITHQSNILTHLQYVMPNTFIHVQMEKIWKPTMHISLMTRHLKYLIICVGPL